MSFQLHPNTRTALKLVCVTLLLVGGFVALLHLAPNHETARIVFASHDGNDFELFSVNPDGSDLRQLTDNSFDDWGATWSPDRMQIAFRSGKDGQSSLYVMDADGQNVRRLSPTQMTVGDPFYQGTVSWSPDGASVVFDAYFTNNWDIWTVGVQNGLLTRMTNDNSDNVHPDWSPDGRQIAFNRYINGVLEIFVMDTDGQNIRQLTQGQTVMSMYPRWSPDSTQIIYFTNDGEQADIHMMSRDGHHLRQLTTHAAVDRVATFSPDGQSIVFRSERDGDSDIYTMNLRSGTIQPVTTNHSMDMSPDW
ncbi:MAG: hypothetical protein ACFE0Q_05340 [Anaerolineae bacterium]